MKKEKLQSLLDLVIDNYINRGDPIGSKYLFSLEETEYAPSTLRKYLHLLEEEGYLYQPYNSAGRVPTVKGFSTYLDTILEEESYELSKIDFNVDFARNGMRFIVEKLGDHVDGAVVGFLRNDEYYFLGINNLLKEGFMSDQESLRHLVGFIENKKLIEFLNTKMIRHGQIHYSFLENHDKVISAIYIKINVNGFDGILAILGPVRVNYKKNVGVLKKFVKYYEQNI